MAGGYLKASGFTLSIGRLDRKTYLPFEPRNENGVVFIFALVAKQLGFDVKHVQAGFPDCLAEWGGKRARIEFEFRSRNFETHGHEARKCDVVVCWKHDWAEMPGGLALVELRKVFGIAHDVFIVAYRDEFWRGLPDHRKPTGLWSVPAKAGEDDLLLVYRPAVGGDEGAITDVFRVATPPERISKPRWRAEPDWMASIQRVAELRAPIRYSRLKRLGAHGGIESRPRRTEEWPALYNEITQRGRPSHSLRRYARL